MKKAKEIRRIISETIRSEGKSVLELEQHITDDFIRAVSAIYQSSGRVVITGVGKSAHIGAKIVATLNSTGTPSIFMHAADAVHGDLGILQKDDVLLCISKSGETSEIKALVSLIDRKRNKIIALTSSPESFLGQNADFVLYAYVEKEVCPHNLAPTTSTTVQMVLGDALAMALLHLRNFSPEDFARFHPGGTLGKRLYLRVSALTEKNDIPAVKPDDSIEKVIMEISGKRLGSTAVLENGTLTGIITDGDLRRMLERKTEIRNLTAADIMTQSPKTTSPDTLVVHALELMKKYNITQLPVLDEGTYTGMIHLHDILKEGIL